MAHNDFSHSQTHQKKQKYNIKQIHKHSLSYLRKCELSPTPSLYTRSITNPIQQKTQFLCARPATIQTAMTRFGPPQTIKIASDSDGFSDQSYSSSSSSVKPVAQSKKKGPLSPSNKGQGSPQTRKNGPPGSSKVSPQSKKELSSSSSSSYSTASIVERDEKADEKAAEKADDNPPAQPNAVAPPGGSGKRDERGIIAGQYKFVKSLGEVGASASGVFVYEKKMMFGLVRGEMAVKKFREHEFESFENECQIYRELRHDLVCEMIACNPEDLTIWMPLYKKNLHYIALDMTGDSKSTLRKTEYLISAAYGLRYVHRRGILHRDIKPGNIFCGSRGRAVIGDFGFALHDYEDGGEGCGTEGFFAPEYLYHKVLTAKNDVWAFGITIYWVCNASHPFGGKDLTLDCGEVQAPKNTVRPAQMPNLWYYIYKKCTIVDPEERFSMEDVCTTIEQFALAKEGSAEARVLMENEDTEFIPPFESGDGKELSIYIDEIKGLTSFDQQTARAPLSGKCNMFLGGFLALLFLYLFSLAFPILAKQSITQYLAGRYHFGSKQSQMIAYETFMLYLLSLAMNVAATVGRVAPLKYRFIWNPLFVVSEILCIFLGKFLPIVAILSAFQMVSHFVLSALSFWYRESPRNKFWEAVGSFSWAYCQHILICRFVYSLQEAVVQQAVGMALIGVSVVFTFLEPSQSIAILVWRIFVCIMSIIQWTAADLIPWIGMTAVLVFYGISIILDSLLRCRDDWFFTYGKRSLGEPFTSFAFWTVLAGDAIGVLITITFLAWHHYNTLPNVETTLETLWGRGNWGRYVLTVLGGIGYMLMCTGVLVLFNKSLVKGLIMDQEYKDTNDEKRKKQVQYARIGLAVAMLVGLFLFILSLYLNGGLLDHWARKAIYWLSLQVFCHYIFDMGSRLLLVPIVMQCELEMTRAFTVQTLVHIFQIIVLGLAISTYIMITADNTNAALLYVTAIMNSFTSFVHSYFLCNHHRHEKTKNLLWKVKWGLTHVFLCLLPIAAWFVCMAMFWIVLIGLIVIVTVKLVHLCKRPKPVEGEQIP